MILFKLAQPEEMNNLFEVMRRETSDFLKDAFWEIGLAESALQNNFENIGQVFIIYSECEPAGFYWIEQRQEVLHLHGIVLRHYFQGLGIGRKVMTSLENRHCKNISAIELGVHHGNRKARRLYDKLGYRLVKHLNDVHFDIMRKTLTGDSYPAGDPTR